MASTLPESGTIICRIELAVSLLCTKWMVPILRQLFIGKQRPSDLKRQLDGISYKILTERLRELADYGLVERTAYPTIPPQVEYQLTERGQELRSVLKLLKRLGESWDSTLRPAAEPQDCPCAGCPELDELCCPLVENSKSIRRLQSKKSIASGMPRAESDEDE